MGNGQYKSSHHRSKSHSSVPSLPRKPSINTSIGAHEKSATPKDGMSRTASGTDINEKNYSIFFPLEKLAKILHQKSQQQYGVNGIAQDVFVKLVFPQYPDFGNRLFMRMHKTAKAKTNYLGVNAFRQQCEIYLSVLDDQVIHEHYVKLFATNGAGTDDIGKKHELREVDLFVINADGLSDLLLTCFRVAVANYIASGSKDSNSELDQSIPLETFCPYIKRTIESVTQSCFFSKDTLSIGFVCRWLENNLPNMILPLHRFCVHTLTTVYRTVGLEAKLSQSAHNVNEASTSGSKDVSNFLNVFVGHRNTMALSKAWLLAAALPPVYTRPPIVIPAKPAPSEKAEVPETPTLSVPSFPSLPDTTATTPNNPTVLHLTSTIPTHWSLLYDSQQHGVGANRFLHHVIGYKGPTLCILRSKSEEVFCIASSAEWRETHLYVGDSDCYIIQLLPKFSILERGPKLLYLNTCVRGYPKGLRAGSDPRKPLLSINEDFEKIEYRGISSILFAIEVYGCGDKQLRDIQLDIKKWQVTEAERQRTVKLTAADWIDHPDRYLLELGGRPQYNNA